MYEAVNIKIKAKHEIKEMFLIRMLVVEIPGHMTCKLRLKRCLRKMSEQEDEESVWT